MTAERPWVRWGARWLARVEAVQGIVQMVTLSMTAASTTLLGLKEYGYGEFALPFLVASATGGIAFAYLYAEGGVWNQKNRDHSDMGNNFATPRDVIDDTLIATGVFAAKHGRPPDEDESEAIRQAVRGQWEELRDGIDLQDADLPGEEVPADD
jgi:hypothetical protein